MGHNHLGAGVAERECLSNFTRRVSGSSLQRSVVAANDVVGVAVARPPTDQAGGHLVVGHDGHGLAAGIGVAA